MLYVYLLYTIFCATLCVKYAAILFSLYNIKDVKKVISLLKSITKWSDIFIVSMFFFSMLKGNVNDLIFIHEVDFFYYILGAAFDPT